MIGQDGVPLSYVIRECAAPDYNVESQPNYNFEQLSINCVLLTGLTYKTDAREVHQLIHRFVQGETSDTWIKTKERKQDSRLDDLALLANYGGKGNKSVQIKESEALRTSLIYKNKGAMPSKKFLKNMQTMLTGFSENGEIFNNSQSILLLFQKVQNPFLTQIKALLQVYYDLDQANTVAYDFISNSLAAEAASLVDHHPQRVADVNTRGKKAPEIGVKGAGGAIFIGFYPNWSKLLDREKQYIFDERERLNIKGGGKRKSFDKKNRAGLHPSSPKRKQLRRSNVRSHL